MNQEEESQLVNRNNPNLSGSKEKIIIISISRWPTKCSNNKNKQSQMLFMFDPLNKEYSKSSKTPNPQIKLNSSTKKRKLSQLSNYSQLSNIFFDLIFSY